MGQLKYISFVKFRPWKTFSVIIFFGRPIFNGREDEKYVLIVLMILIVTSVVRETVSVPFVDIAANLK